jgi:hypothetical protein
MSSKKEKQWFKVSFVKLYEKEVFRFFPYPRWVFENSKMCHSAFVNAPEDEIKKVIEICGYMGFGTNWEIEKCHGKFE